MTETARVLKSNVSKDGALRVCIVDEPMPEPGVDDVVVAIEAAPITRPILECSLEAHGTIPFTRMPTWRFRATSTRPR